LRDFSYVSIAAGAHDRSQLKAIKIAFDIARLSTIKEDGSLDDGARKALALAESGVRNSYAGCVVRAVNMGPETSRFVISCAFPRPLA